MANDSDLACERLFLDDIGIVGVTSDSDEGGRRGQEADSLPDDDNEEQEQQIEPRILVARSLGQPGCDFQSDPFKKQGRRWKPSKDILMTEYLRRRDLLRARQGDTEQHDLPAEAPPSPIPNKQPRRHEIESWLRDNPVTDQHEIENLRAQFRRHKKQLEAPTRDSVVNNGSRAVDSAMGQLKRQEREKVPNIAFLAPRLVLARALGLPGCDFQEKPFHRRKRYTPSRNDLLDECERRINIMGVRLNRNNRYQYPNPQWRKDGLADWLRDNRAPESSQETLDLTSRVAELSYEIEEATLVVLQENALAPDDANFDAVDTANMGNNTDVRDGTGGHFSNTKVATEDDFEKTLVDTPEADRFGSTHATANVWSITCHCHVEATGIMSQDDIGNTLVGMSVADATRSKPPFALDAVEEAVKTDALSDEDFADNFTFASVDSMDVSSTSSALMKLSLGSSTNQSSGNPNSQSSSTNSTLSSSRDDSGLTADSMKQSRIRGAGLQTVKEGEVVEPCATQETVQLIGIDKIRESQGNEDDDSVSVLSEMSWNIFQYSTGEQWSLEVEDVKLYDGGWRRGVYTGTCNRSLLRQVVPHGKGRMVYTSGLTYEGGWAHGFWDGHGNLNYAENDSYAGSFVQGSFSGHGVRRWPDGSEYEGGWGAGKRSGNGTFRNSNGDVSEGKWLNDKLEGQGVLRFASGCQYSGMFVDGHQQGACIYKDHLGRVHAGMWVSNLCISAGMRYDGFWKNGKAHGFGRRLDSLPGVYEGTCIQRQALTKRARSFPHADSA